MSKRSIIFQIHKDLVRGKLQLPTLPQVSLRIKKTASDPNTDIHKLSTVAESDPAFCGYLLQISNSPIYRGAVDIQNINLAIARLGIQNTSNLAMSYAIRALFSEKNKNNAHWLEHAWKNSTYTASVACVIAEHIQKSFDPDEALLAGLIQDIGCLPLIDKAEEYPELIENEKAMFLLFDRYACSVGAAVLRKWGLHSKFLDVVKNRDNWEYDSSPEANLTDLVLIAKMHTYLGHNLLKPVPKINQVPAFFKLQLEMELSPEASLKFIADAKQRITDMRNALGGL